MVTTRQAAPSVRLNGNWQSKYRLRAQELLASSPPRSSRAFCVCIVGRSGVGKGSLINHLLQQRLAKVSHNSTSLPDEESSFNIHGFRVREIPGYDGPHSVAPATKRLFHRSGSGSNSGLLELGEFVQAYRLFEVETNAIIFVVNNRITDEDKKLISLAIDSRKFFCVVRTHADSLVPIADSTFQRERLEEIEEELRRELCMGGSLDVRVFIMSIPWPESKATGSKLDGSDLQDVLKNVKCLNFPLLQAYLSEPKGLCDELQIHAYVKEEVSQALEPFYNVKKRHQLLEFSEHLVAGTLLPIAGPVMLTFFKMLYVALKACSDVGLIEDADDAMQKVNADANKNKLITRIASKEGMMTAVHDSMVHIFGKVIFEIAIADIVSTAAETTLTGSFPVVGAVITAAHLRSRFRKVADKLAVKACMLHELWIMQNVTGLLSTV